MNLRRSRILPPPLTPEEASEHEAEKERIRVADRTDSVIRPWEVGSACKIARDSRYWERDPNQSFVSFDYFIRTLIKFGRSSGTSTIERRMALADHLTRDEFLYYMKSNVSLSMLGIILEERDVRLHPALFKLALRGVSCRAIGAARDAGRAALEARGPTAISDEEEMLGLMNRRIQRLTEGRRMKRLQAREEREDDLLMDRLVVRIEELEAERDLLRRRLAEVEGRPDGQP